jgi:amidophosphoribosyltransferase
VRISSPPVQWPCFYGIDFASRAELIATGLQTDEIRRSIDADSLGYVSLDGLVAATRLPKDNLCRACFDGVYPVELPLSERMGKHLLGDPARLERRREPVRTDADGLSTLQAGVGAADALSRP